MWHFGKNPPIFGALDAASSPSVLRQALSLKDDDGLLVDSTHTPSLLHRELAPHSSLRRRTNLAPLQPRQPTQRRKSSDDDESTNHSKSSGSSTNENSLNCLSTRPFYNARLRLLSPPRSRLRPPSSSIQNLLEGGVSSCFPSTPPLSGGGGGGFGPEPGKSSPKKRPPPFLTLDLRLGSPLPHPVRGEAEREPEREGHKVGETGGKTRAPWLFPVLHA